MFPSPAASDDHAMCSFEQLHWQEQEVQHIGIQHRAISLYWSLSCREEAKQRLQSGYFCGHTRERGHFILQMQAFTDAETGDCTHLPDDEGGEMQELAVKRQEKCLEGRSLVPISRMVFGYKWWDRACVTRHSNDDSPMRSNTYILQLSRWWNQL